MRTLGEDAAYDAMCLFLEAYWERGHRGSEDLAVLLGNLSRDVWSDRMSADPAMWSDWQEAVTKAVERRT